MSAVAASKSEVGRVVPNAPWPVVQLGDVIESMKNGIYKPASFYAEDGLACLRMYNIGEGQIVWRDIKRMRIPEEEILEYELKPGDLLVNRVNSRELVGKSAIIPVGLERCIFESKNIRVRLHRNLVEPKFVSYQLLSSGSRYFDQNAQQVVGMASISQPQVSRFPIVLPPLPTQRRIVAEIEKQFTRLDAGVAALRRVRANLKRYRAAVLKAACEGRLVPVNSSGWKQATLADVCAKITDGDHQPPPRAEAGIPFLTIGNISSRKLDFENTRFVPQSYYNQIKEDRIPRRNDIVYSVVGATIGIPVLVNTDSPFCFQRHIALLKPSPSILPKFLWLTMASPDTFKAAWRGTTGTAQPTLPLKALRSLPILLPPIADQKRIVAEVERRLSVIDELETLATANLTRATRLRQSILQLAFNGGISV